MQVNVLWTGREYYSLENCLVKSNDAGVEISSSIVGRYGAIIYRVEYQIKTNLDWETIFFEVKSQHNNATEHLKFNGDGKGNWVTYGKVKNEFEGCIDIDIPLTPFTNSLPINRLKMGVGETKEIKVIYIDLLENQITPVRQKYTKLSKNQYQYENIPRDFEATIEVDDLGFVVDYPSLFVRTASLHGSYV